MERDAIAQNQLVHALIKRLTQLPTKRRVSSLSPRLLTLLNPSWTRKAIFTVPVKVPYITIPLINLGEPLLTSYEPL